MNLYGPADSTPFASHSDAKWSPAPGAATEARILDAFADRALITAAKCCWILGLSPKTLRGMTDRGLIGAVLIGAKGTTRQYTEADVRAYLTGPRAPVRPQEKDLPCPSISRKARASINTTSSTKVVGFTEALAKRRAEKPKR